MRTSTMILLVAAALLTVPACSQKKPSPSFAFALIGDAPYASRDSMRFEALIDMVNADDGVAWVIHAGDIKQGGAPCSDAFLEGRRAALDRFERPVVLTPGDNEWTDCHRENAGGYDPLERLKTLRSLFYPEVGRTFGSPSMDVESQAAIPGFETYRENVRWERDGVHFATLHVVGSRNGLAPFEGRTEASDEEVRLRMKAARSWLTYVFERAVAAQARGLFLTLHAALGLERTTQIGERPEYEALLMDLVRETKRFRKPVILAHGDSHYFRIDKPVRDPDTGKRLINLTRVETFGAADVHWVKVVAAPEDPEVFRFEPQTVRYGSEK